MTDAAVVVMRIVCGECGATKLAHIEARSDGLYLCVPAISHKIAQVWSNIVDWALDDVETLAEAEDEASVLEDMELALEASRVAEQIQNMRPENRPALPIARLGTYARAFKCSLVAEQAESVQHFQDMDGWCSRCNRHSYVGNVVLAWLAGNRKAKRVATVEPTLRHRLRLQIAPTLPERLCIYRQVLLLSTAQPTT